MKLSEFLNYICCWDGEIILNSRTFVEVSKGHFQSSYIDDEEPINAHFENLIKYLDWTVICFTPCYNPNTDRVWLEIMIEEPKEE